MLEAEENEMEKLWDLLDKAKNSAAGAAEWGGVGVEYNGGVIFYTIDGVECTASQAISRLDELSA